MANTNNRKNLRLFLLGGGVFLLLCGWSMYSQGNCSVSEVDNWTQVQAVIIKAEIETVTMNNQYSRGPSFVTGYEPAITYRYSLEGHSYEGNRFTIAPAATQDRDTVAALVASHPVGAEITAWVNPEEPSEAVISRSDEGQSLVLVIIGMFLVVIGLGGIGAAAILRNRPDTSRPCRIPVESHQPPVGSHEAK